MLLVSPTRSKNLIGWLCYGLPFSAHTSEHHPVARPTRKTKTYLFLEDLVAVGSPRLFFLVRAQKVGIQRLIIHHGVRSLWIGVGTQ